jgi:recombination protein RecR
MSAMFNLPPTIQELKSALNKLPSIGPRSAERIALHIVQCKQDPINKLIKSIQEAKEKIALCEICGGLTESQPCGLCSDPLRQKDCICLIVKPTDILNIEKCHAYRGQYHVLGGQISPMNGVGPDDLRIRELEQRIQDEKIQEVILALGSDVEGDATSFYLAQRLANLKVKVTRIAQGLPAGSELDYADELTLGKALEGRNNMPHE